MMDYEIFKELVAEQFLNYLPAEFKDFGVKLETVHKTNETLDGLAVVPPADRAGEVFPTVYVDHMYDVTTCWAGISGRRCRMRQKNGWRLMGTYRRRAGISVFWALKKGS